jgi:hypothetical protein
VASFALARWQSTGLSNLDQLGRIHRLVTGARGSGRWGTTQLNRGLFVALLAQFQAFCRDLHDEAVGVHVAVATIEQRPVIRALLEQGRKLDSGTPRSSALGADFGRLGFNVIDELRALGPATGAQLDALDRVADFRNAVSHGKAANIAALERSGPIKSTLRSYSEHRKTLEALATTIDTVVARQLAATLGVAAPW